MNLLKLNMKQSIFTSIIIIISSLIAVAILPLNEDLIVYTSIIAVMAAFIGGILSKVLLPESKE